MRPVWPLWLCGALPVAVLALVVIAPTEFHRSLARGGSVFFIPLLLAMRHHRDAVLRALGWMVAYYAILCVVEVVVAN